MEVFVAFKWFLSKRSSFVSFDEITLMLSHVLEKLPDIFLKITNFTRRRFQLI